MTLVSHSPRTPKGSVPPDPRLLMYRLSKNRSRSCGTAFRSNGVGQMMVSRGSRKADFSDTGVIVVQTLSERDDGVIRNGANSAIGDYSTDVTKKGMETFQNGKTIPGKNGFARLDLNTLQNIGWVSGASDDKKHETLCTAEDFCSMTKVEFRRLQEQVRDVSMNLKNKFRTSAYQHPMNDYQSGHGEKFVEKNEDPDQTPLSSASDLGLRCLPMSSFIDATLDA